MTYAGLKETLQNVPKLEGKISRGFLKLAKDEKFCLSAGAALYKRFGKLTKADAAKQKMEDFEFAMFEIRMKDANLPLSSSTLWSMGGRKMASGLTADCIDPTNGWYPDYKGQTTHL